MAQRCLKCLKYTMCLANFLCFLCGVAVLCFGVYMMVTIKTPLTPTLAKFNLANMLLISGIVITCVSFLGFLGALKENRCLLLTFFLILFLMMLVELAAACLLLLYENKIGEWVKQDLTAGLDRVKNGPRNSTDMSEWDLLQTQLKCCGVLNVTDWGDRVPKSCCADKCDTPRPSYHKGCVEVMQNFFEENFLFTGISVIVLCVIEVLGMCFAMTLFCHISRSGLGYKL
ncbi:leukocyte surface antigen CD53 [Xyrichtys novacula]|uniref:Tetraspanin n=1 Tax=Xyrichtys novacula TaxID=13765 RepID=A0AAV1G6D8_XYRNO|nr:leukocyte surface antigen CD53 [Xyrichtys novacula]